MAQIIWSPCALEDIDLIAEYISRDSEDNTSLFVYRLMSSVEQLQDFPYSGRIIPEIGNEKSREIILDHIESCTEYRELL